MKEVWKDVVGYEGYYMVSNLGRVKSLDRFVNSKNGSRKISRGKVLIPAKVSCSYLAVSLSRCGSDVTTLIHRLVASAFVPKKNGREQVNHKDGNKLNNMAKNLEWVTARENILHSYAAGMSKVGSKSVKSKLTEDKVKKILALLDEGKRKSHVAKMFGVNHCTVLDIVKGRSWRHVTNSKEAT